MRATPRYKCSVCEVSSAGDGCGPVGDGWALVSQAVGTHRDAIQFFLCPKHADEISPAKKVS